MNSIRQSVAVPVAAERAFAVFAKKLESWWPPEFTWSGNVLETIAIEPWEGGRCLERGPYGFEVDWGRYWLGNRLAARHHMADQLQEGTEAEPGKGQRDRSQVRV